MKIIAVSDIVADWIYSPKIRFVLSDIDLVIGCGDLPTYYLEYIVSSLDIPLLHVHGNHSIPEPKGDRNVPSSSGSVDLHCRMVRYKGYTFAGIEGSLRYKNGPYLYSQTGMWLNVFRLVPDLLRNRFRFGNYLNVFITHAPPWGIHDQPDLTHQGIKAFRWLLATFQPDYHLHGHIHVYRPDMVTESNFGKTRVLNAYGYRRLEI
jgi:Icc-related predicted phosphoesterase